MAIDYASKIPNNVNLDQNKTLQRALEGWQPKYLEWWKEMGPSVDCWVKSGAMSPSWMDMWWTPWNVEARMTGEYGGVNY